MPINDQETVALADVREPARLIQQLTAAQKPTFDINGVPHVLVPEGFKVEPKPKLADRPQRVDQSITAHDFQGFVDYVNKFKTDSTVIFAEIQKSLRFVACIDYHRQSMPGGSIPALPSHNEHRVICGMPYSEEWNRWVNAAAATKKMSQAQFAEFVEDNQEAIVEPEGAVLLTQVLNFKEARNVSFSAAQSLQDGTVNLAYSADNGVAGNTKLPQKLKLGIPVFLNGDRYAVSARLKYRLDGPKLEIWYEVERPDLVIAQASKDAIAAVQAQTGIAPFRGSIG